MFGKEKKSDEWRGGVYLTTVEKSFDADLLESKLRGEGIPCIKKYGGASNAMEIIMGSNIGFSIDLYVPEEDLEDAKNIILAVPLLSDEMEDISDEELERQAMEAGVDGDFFEDAAAEDYAEQESEAREDEVKGQEE